MTRDTRQTTTSTIMPGMTGAWTVISSTASTSCSRRWSFVESIVNHQLLEAILASELRRGTRLARRNFFTPWAGGLQIAGERPSEPRAGPGIFAVGALSAAQSPLFYAGDGRHLHVSCDCNGSLGRGAHSGADR